MSIPDTAKKSGKSGKMFLFGTKGWKNAFRHPFRSLVLPNRADRRGWGKSMTQV